MPLLQPIAGRAFYLPGANNLGVVLDGAGGAIAIDTGIDKDTGRLIRKALDEAGARLHTIINTHHHADHIGGNDYLVRNYSGTRVYAPRLEAGLIEQPELEPIYLSFGAAPLPALRTKWLMAKGVPVDHRFEGTQLQAGGVDFDIVPLPGHSLGQVGLALDGVLFAADGLFGTETLNKHGVPFAHDIGAQLESLQRIDARSDAFVLPGHGALLAREHVAGAIAANRAAIEQTSSLVCAALEQPATLMVIASRVQTAYGLQFAGMPQYAVFLSVINAQLAYLERQKLAQVALAADGMIWSATV